MSKQADLHARMQAGQQAREWQHPLEPWPDPRPTWVDEHGHGVEPGTWPALPECSIACPWRKPQRVILAERALDEACTLPWPRYDECQFPAKVEREVDDHDVCWPALARLRIEGNRPAEEP